MNVSLASVSTGMSLTELSFAQLGKEGGAPPTLWELIMAGEWVMVPLALCSVLVVMLVIFLLLTLRAGVITSSDLRRRSQQLLEKQDLAALAAYVAEKPQAVARVMDEVLKFMYRHKDAESEAIQSVAEAEGNRIASTLNQRSIYLMDLGVLAPMLGLFGTVVGILRSFGSISTEASAMRTTMMAGGVAQALIATAVGLVVGIFAMACYSYFRGRVTSLVSTMEAESTTLVQEIILVHKRQSSTRRF